MAVWRKSYQTLLAGLVVALTLGWLFSLPINVRFHDLIVERAYYADVDGKDDINSVQQRSFTRYQGPLFHGNDIRPLWLRLTLAPAADSDWVLMFQPNYVHLAEVWQPDQQGSWRRKQAGIALAFNQREVKTLVPAVRVMPDARQRTIVYVRVQTPTTPLHVRVISRDNSAQFDALMSTVAGAFIGIGLIMTLLSAMVYINTRDRLWGLDAIYNSFGIGVLSLQVGFASRLLFPDSMDLVNYLSLFANLTVVFITALLHNALFGLFALPRWMYWPNRLILIAYPVLLGLITLGFGDKAMMLSNGMIFIASLWGGVIAFGARHRDKYLLKVFKVMYVGLMLYCVWWSLPIVLGLQTGNIMTVYPSLPVSFFSMMMLALILLRNTQLKVREARNLAMVKREVELDLKQTQLRHAETHSFLGMVLHEIKNPLSAIRMIVSNLENTVTDRSDAVQQRLQRVHVLVEDIDDVLERGVEIDSMEQGGLVVARSTVNVVALISDFQAEHEAASRLQIRLPALLIAEVDVHLLLLMLRNLVDNALKYAPENSPIMLVLTPATGHWCLEVRSLVGAVGFPDSDKVFNKYYRSPLAMRRSGLGLGLYWVRGVARHLGGDAMYARDTNWVVFTLCLPN